MASRKRLQYQVTTGPVLTAENITQDKWYQSWSEPVKQKIAPALAIALMASGLVSPVPVSPNLIPGSQIVTSAVTPQVTFKKRFIYQSKAEPVNFTAPAVPAVENTATSSQVTYDKWIIYQSKAETPFVPAVTAQVATSSISSQVAYRQGLIYQSIAQPVPFGETVTVDKWFAPWQEPVRQKAGLRTNLQQSIAQTVLEPNSQITQNFEPRWHQPWSEPVRTRQIITALQPSFFAPSELVPVAVAEVETAAISSQVTYDKWIIYQSKAETPFVPSVAVQIATSAISSQVAYRQGLIYQSIAQPVVFAETITVDKWIYPWSEPVRQKQGLRSYLQQAAIGPVLEPNTQITQTFESRWHQPWSEPVRLRRFPAAEQQSSTLALPTETVTIDKWLYQWSEPVRQKAGLRAHLQQALIATTLDNDTQIIQTYESRWHQPWSEPKRFKPSLPAGEQQAQVQAGVFPLENITEDKWHFPWSEPVRQKLGLRAHLQQALIAPVLEPNTQIIQTYESRWHFAWSEPVRTRLFPTAEQQSLAFQPPPLETITADKWLYPWSEPVRQKQGLRANLQQASIQTVLDPETQITQTYESRWHQGWSEPVRFRRFPTAEQQAFTTGFPELTDTFESRWHQPWSEPVRFRRFHTSQQQSFAGPYLSFEIINYDKWGFGLSEPVRFRIDPKRAIALAAPFNAGPVLDPDSQISPDRESKWHQPWSEPVRFRIDKRLAVALGASGPFAPVLEPNTEIIQKYESRWHYPWSEPVRIKPGLRAWLHPFIFPDTPIYPNLVRIIPWFAPLNEPVRVKIWIHPSRVPFFWTTPEAILSDITVTFSVRETNADSALLAIKLYGVPATCVVSIKEIPFQQSAVVSIVQPETISNLGYVSVGIGAGTIDLSGAGVSIATGVGPVVIGIISTEALDPIDTEDGKDLETE